MNRYACPANFASHIRTPLLRQHYVYRAFNAEGELLYVGCSYDVLKRLQSHSSQSREWWSLQTRLVVAGPYNYETARQLEWEAIETERPLANYTSERRAIARAWHDVYNAESNATGWGDPIRWAAQHDHCEAVANRWVYYPGNRQLFRIKDGDVLRAKAAVRDHGRELAEATA